MKNCWFCGYDIHKPAIHAKNRSDRPSYDVKVFDTTKSIMKTVKICEFCYISVNSALTSLGFKYQNSKSIISTWLK